MVRKVPVASEQSKDFILRGDLAGNAPDVVESFFDRASGHVDISDVEITLAALKVKSGGSARGNDFPFIMIE